MHSDKFDTYLDSLWKFYNKNKDPLSSRTHTDPLALHYMFLLKSTETKDFPNYILGFKDKLKDFVTPENTNLLVTKAKLLKDMLFVLKNITKIKNKQIEPNPYAEAAQLIDEIGADNLKHFDPKHPLQLHNLVKFIVFKFVNGGNQHDEFEGAETKYIEILESAINTVDYTQVEQMFSTTDINNTTAELVFQMILDQENPVTQISNERKIDHLFHKRILIPITDEFLRYHKSSERIDTSDAQKKIDKIRYVVSKIHQIMDFYSKGKPKQNLFYPPMAHKKAVLYNDIEEINSIMKIVKIGKTAMKSNENFSDLVSYRSYPFINFHDFKDYGFPLKFYNTSDAIRAVNFEYTENIKHYIQWRVASADMKVNVVGVALPRYIFKPATQKNTNHIQCMKVKNTKNLHDIYRNAFDVVVKKLEHMIIEGDSYNRLGYWVFDGKNDRVNRKSKFNNINFENYFKNMIASIYDKVEEMAYFRLKNNIEPGTSIAKGMGMIEETEEKLVPLNNYLPLVLYEIYYAKAQQHPQEYDTNEDKIPGLNTDIKDIPRFKEDKKGIREIKIMHSESTNLSHELTPADNSVCQHIVSWNTIRTNTRSPNYNQMLFEFIKRYIRENAENDYVCKSCYQIVDLKKHIHDWSSMTEGVAMSFSLESQLDKMPEYDKYNRFIKYMDKIVERFAYVGDISFYLGNMPQIKLRRQEIIRNIIDFITIQHKTQKNDNPEQRKTKQHKFGINKDYDMFFLFELKNEIITFSSKDTDKFKILKRNNIYIYMLMFIMTDINANQLLALRDRYSYEDFNKAKNRLFDGLMIKANNTDIRPILDFPLLCYAVFVGANILVKSKLWNGEPKTALNFIINTFVNVVNTILEVNVLPQKDYRYELFATRFFFKLKNTYSKNMSDRMMQAAVLQRKKILGHDTPLTGQLSTNDFGFVQKLIRPAVRTPMSFVQRVDYLDKSETTSLENTLYKSYLLKLFNLYTLDGTKRPIATPPSDKDIQAVTHTQLESMYNNIIKRKQLASDKKEDKRKLKLQKYQDKLASLYDVQNNLSKHHKSRLFESVDQFIRKVDAIIGSDVNINNSNIYLKHNVYITYHDYKGTLLKEPLAVAENDKHFEFKKNDMTFKTDVYSIKDTKNNVTMYFNAKDTHFMGYKDGNGKMILVGSQASAVSKPFFLQINHSILNKLLFLGYNSLYLDSRKYDEVTRSRINNLKLVLLEYQKLLYQLKNKVKNVDPVIREFVPKFKSIELFDDAENAKIFSDVHDVIDSAFIRKVDFGLKTPKKEIYVHNLLKHENTDHVLVKYLCAKMSRIIDVNTDKYTKTNICFLLVNIIDSQFNRFFIRTFSSFNNDVKLYNFLYAYQNVAINDDDNIVDRLIEEGMSFGDTLLNDETSKEIRTDNIEENEALDAQQDTPDANDDMGDEDVVFMSDD